MAPNLYRDLSGVDTALTAVCSSRLGTGPMWLFMRSVHHLLLLYVMLISIMLSSK